MESYSWLDDKDLFPAQAGVITGRTAAIYRRRPVPRASGGDPCKKNGIG